MTSQFDMFGGAGDAPGPELPEGFRYREELISSADEETILRHVRELPFREFELHGYTGKRRVVSFGWRYDFSARRLDRDVFGEVVGISLLAPCTFRLRRAVGDEWERVNITAARARASCMGIGAAALDSGFRRNDGEGRPPRTPRPRRL